MGASRVLLAVAFFSFVACSRGPANRATEADRNAVYAAVLDSLYLGVAQHQDHRPVTLVVLSVRTAGIGLATAAVIDAWRQTLPAIPLDLWSAFTSANASHTVLPAIAGLRSQQHVLSSPEEDELFPQDPRNLEAAWSAFYKRFPGSAGIANLSNVGFSRDGNWALVGFGRACASLCAESYDVLLHRIGGNWQIVDTFGGIVS